MTMLQRAILYIKEVQDVTLFAAMSNSRLYMAFVASPLFYVMLPFIGILLSALAVINGYHLVNAKDKDFEKWFTFISSALTAIAASISLYGAVIAEWMGATFIAGPWLFLGAVLVGVVYQSVMLGCNLYDWNTKAEPEQRENAIQSALANVFSLLTLAGIVGTLTFVMLTSVAPLVGSAFAITSAVFIAANIGWRLIPSNWTDALKVNLRLIEDPESVLNAESVKDKTADLTAEAAAGTVYKPVFGDDPQDSVNNNVDRAAHSQNAIDSTSVALMQR